MPVITGIRCTHAKEYPSDSSSEKAKKEDTKLTRKYFSFMYTHKKCIIKSSFFLLQYIMAKFHIQRERKE